MNRFLFTAGIPSYLLRKCTKSKKNYNLRLSVNFLSNRNESLQSKNPDNFDVPFLRTVFHGSENILYLGPKVWDILPASIEEENSLSILKIN